MKIQENVPLAQYAAWKIGGIADYFIEVAAGEELLKALEFAKKKNIPFFILGGGTNILFSDKGFRGLVIRNKTNTIRIVSYRGAVKKQGVLVNNIFIKADSGVSVNRLVRFSLDQGLTGLENFLGQPGTVGGAMYINAHNIKMNDFFGDHIIQASIANPSGEVVSVDSSYFNFNYDESSIQKTRDIVLSVVLRLEKSIDSKTVLWQKAEKIMQHRIITQPKGRPTAGCTFRNIAKSDALRLGTPNHTQSAGYLIDACGLKGYRVGGAEISKAHANFILNADNATATDVKKLIDLAKIKVKDKFGIDLHEEVVLVGEF